MELEALESIYMEDYVLLSEEGAHPASLQLRLCPCRAKDREEGGNFVAALLKVTYTNCTPRRCPRCVWRATRSELCADQSSVISLGPQQRSLLAR